MDILTGWGSRVRGLFADTKGPWGSSGSDGGEDPTPDSDSGKASNPWGDAPKSGRRAGIRSANVTSLDELLRRGRARLGGDGGGHIPGRPPGTLIVWGVIALVLLWLLFTSFHAISPGQRGVVTQFGRYSRTLGPGVSFTLPSPIERVAKIDVENIRSIDMGTEGSDDLMLTGDQNLLDLAYSVRWNIRNPERYLFQMDQPDETIREVAESAMRAVISQVSLNDAMGDRRAEIETQVAENMQRILDSYRSGIQVQGIAIKQADPPDAVNDAFKQVTAAQQDAQTYINNANAYALQLGQKAQGEATAFDKVYEQYRLAPEVTRKRMYYETMEQVLSKVDKTVIEAPGVNSYLPLPQLKNGQQPPAPERAQ
ncbi:FtsH protease activity modulator HflK [Sphingomonas flavescens]|jgi:membrane protease subunit HflK|uniref:FtsH protease activity modulator HflK n=1 Tax=Sphingomonas flavescens TaxID=3132797 RepID=UPI002803AE96|nr:FtsH protease activity modulator HflK [Sphingomonas limnosediminicola]